MSIEITSRSFVMSIPNDAQDMYLHLRCNHNHMGDWNHFIRMQDMGFKNLRGEHNFIANSHKVASLDNGMIEAPSGNIQFEIIDGVVHLKPFGGKISEYVFKVPLIRLAEMISNETRHGRWDDYCLGQAGYNGHVVYFYSHVLFDDVITVTDRESFYVQLHRKEFGWTRGQFYITNEMWHRLAEIHRTNPEYLPPHDVPVTAQMIKIMRFFEFNSVADVKKFFNVL